MELKGNNNCFVCGKENKDGLKLDFKLKGDKIQAEFIPDKRFEGFDGIVHGGIVATVLDEAMVKLAFEMGMNAVTSKINVELKKPTIVGKRYFVMGEIVEEKEKTVQTKAILEDGEKGLIAQAEAVLVKRKMVDRKSVV